MMKERVISMIDNKIRESMVNGLTTLAISTDMEVRCRNFRKVILQGNPDLDIDGLVRTGEWENVKETRYRYMIFYVGHGEKRLSDIEWIKSNKSKFPKFSNSQIFSLIKLKEKLQLKTEKVV